MSESSRIKTLLTPDPPRTLSAAYAMGRADRVFLDSQMRGVQEHLTESLIRGQISSWFQVDSGSAALAVGDLFCVAPAVATEGDPLLAVRKVTKAVSAAIAAAGGAIGVATTAAPPGAWARGAVHGIVGPGTTGLAAGSAGPVRASSGGRCERVAAYLTGDFPIGYVDGYGNLTLDITRAVSAAEGAILADWKDSARVATTAALAASTRVANVRTANANGALASVDGVALSVNDAILDKDHATGADRGVWAVTSLGSAGTPWVLTRRVDFDSSGEVTSGAHVPITEGSVNGGKTFRVTTVDPIVLNTTALTFVEAGGSAAGVILANGTVPFTAAQSMGGFKLTSLGTPTVSTDAATKAYVDSLVVPAAIDWKESVRVATTANITLSGEQTLDGVTTSASRVLVKNQSTGSQNGVYVSGAGAWARATDFDISAEVTCGATCFVEEGTANGGKLFMLTTTGAITLGSTALTFTQLSSMPVGSAIGQTLVWNGSAFVAGALDLADADARTGLLPFTSIADGSATSLFGRSANSVGAQASIAASIDGQTVTRQGGALSFGVPNFLALALTAGITVLAPAAAASGTNKALTVTGAAHTNQTLSAELVDVDLALNRTVQFATGALTTQRASVVRAPTYGFVGASTITTAATFAITGAPVAGTNATITNPYALWVQAGKSQFDGALSSGTTATLLEANEISGRGFVGINIGVDITATELPSTGGDNVTLFGATTTEPTAKPAGNAIVSVQCSASKGLVAWSNSGVESTIAPGGEGTAATRKLVGYHIEPPVTVTTATTQVSLIEIDLTALNGVDFNNGTLKMRFEFTCYETTNSYSYGGELVALVERRAGTVTVIDVQSCNETADGLLGSAPNRPTVFTVDASGTTVRGRIAPFDTTSHTWFATMQILAVSP